MRLNDVALWINDSWELFGHSNNTISPVILHSVPLIKSKSNVKFEILE